MIKRNIIASFLGKAVNAGVVFVFTPLYIRLLGIESYGTIGLYQSFLILSLVLEAGLGTTLSREFSRYTEGEDTRHHLLRTFEWIYLLIGFMIACSSLYFSPYLCLAIAFQIPFFLYAQGLMGLQKQATCNVVSALGSLLRYGGGFAVLYLFGADLSYFFMWHMGVNLALTLSARRLLLSSLPTVQIPPHFCRKLLSPLKGFACQVGAISVTSLFIGQIDKWILHKVLPPDSFGYYCLASYIAVSFTAIAFPLFSAYFPAFSQLAAQGKKEELKRLYYKGWKVVLLIVLPPALLLIGFPQEVLLFWTKDPLIAMHAAPILSCLMIGSMIFSLMYIPYALRLALGKTKPIFYLHLFAAFVLVPLTAFAAYLVGPLGGCLAWVVLAFGYLVVGIPYEKSTYY